MTSLFSSDSEYSYQDDELSDESHKNGEITFQEVNVYDSDNEDFILDMEPGIYTYKYGSLKWERFTTLSHQKFTEHHKDISKYISNLNDQNKKYTEKFTKIEKDMDILKNIFLQSQNQHIIKAIFEKSKLNFAIRDICSGCCKNAINKKKCFYVDTCPGLCEECELISKDGICNACGKSQRIQCPTCYMEKTSEQMCKSNHCSHSVCWECRGKSCRAGNPIEICPLCRAKID